MLVLFVLRTQKIEKHDTLFSSAFPNSFFYEFAQPMIFLKILFSALRSKPFELPWLSDRYVTCTSLEKHLPYATAHAHAPATTHAHATTSLHATTRTQPHARAFRYILNSRTDGKYRIRAWKWSGNGTEGKYRLQRNCDRAKGQIQIAGDMGRCRLQISAGSPELRLNQQF